VGVGDLFLFFGWFRRTIWTEEELRFAPAGENLHVIFGWLQVGAVCKPSTAGNRLPAWVSEHPHVQGAAHYPANNTLYVASSKLDLPGLGRRVPGGGLFPRYVDVLRLTAPDRSRGFWRVPGWWWPQGGLPALSYHGDLKRWRRRADKLTLRTVGRGQEFVLDPPEPSAAQVWLSEIFQAAVSPQESLGEPCLESAT
jgi:hypothetical protein